MTRQKFPLVDNSGILFAVKKNEKALRETQTLRADCSKAEPKISPRRRSFPGAQDGQNLISWRNPVW